MPSPRPDPVCVRCGRAQVAISAPFCSAGCKDRDLLDWLDERHVLPGADGPEVLDNLPDDA